MPLTGHLTFWIAIILAVIKATGANAVGPSDAQPVAPRPFVDGGQPPITSENIEAFRAYVGDVVLSDRVILSVHDANVLATVRGNLTVHLRELTPEFAAALARHKGSLAVHGPVAISEKCAALLGQHQSSLRLPDCRIASAAAVRSLCVGNKKSILLGIETITEDIAKELATYKGDVYFPNATRLDDEVATILKRHEGMLELRFLRSMSPSTASALADKKGEWFARLGSADVPLRLTTATAAELARTPDTIQINNVVCEPDEASVLSALSRGRTGATIITASVGVERLICALGGAMRPPQADGPLPEIAHELTHCGDLTIDREVRFSAEMAKALASRDGGRILIRPTGLSEPVATILAHHGGPLEISGPFDDTKPDDAAVAAFLLCRHSIGIPATWLTASTIESVLRHRGGISITPTGPVVIRLSTANGGIVADPPIQKWMSHDLYERLLKYEGPLHLCSHVPAEMTALLPLHRGPVALEVLPQGEAAKPLLKCEGPLFFTRDSSVTSIEAARVFAFAANRTTVCTSEHLIGPQSASMADIMVQRRGEISLPRLRYISVDALRILSQKEDVRLPPLEDLYILDEAGRDVAACDVMSERFATINAERQPPPDMPRWHSWEHILEAADTP